MRRISQRLGGTGVDNTNLFEVQEVGGNVIFDGGTVIVDAVNDILDITGAITVSGTVDGRDVAADGTKLDTIETSATADQSAAEILAALLTVDGAGSGLDADALDGQAGTYYLDSTNLTGTINTSRISGSYTGITAVGALGTTDVGTYSSGNYAQRFTSANHTFKQSGDTANELSQIIWVNNSGVTTANIWKTGDAGASAPLRIKSLGPIHFNVGEVGIDGTAPDAYVHSTGFTVTGTITVTGTVDGRDVAADGSKLDGIETSATADQSAAEILAALLTVDGTGTGLDADTVDGSHASAFASSTQGATADAALPKAGGAMTGPITTNSTFDGRDVAADGATLDGLAPLVAGIQMWPSGTAPTGYLKCDGSAVSRTTYAGIFAITSTSYGAGDGSTTFNLPNFQDRVPLGGGANNSIGATTHAMSASSIKTSTSASISAHSNVATQSVSTGVKDASSVTVLSALNDHSSITVDTVFPTVVVSFIIKT